MVLTLLIHRITVQLKISLFMSIPSSSQPKASKCPKTPDATRDPSNPKPRKPLGNPYPCSINRETEKASPPHLCMHLSARIIACVRPRPTGRHKETCVQRRRPRARASLDISSREKERWRRGLDDLLPSSERAGASWKEGNGESLPKHGLMIDWRRVSGDFGALVSCWSCRGCVGLGKFHGTSWKLLVLWRKTANFIDIEWMTVWLVFYTNFLDSDIYALSNKIFSTRGTQQ